MVVVDDCCWQVGVEGKLLSTYINGTGRKRTNESDRQRSLRAVTPSVFSGDCNKHAMYIAVRLGLEKLRCTLILNLVVSSSRRMAPSPFSLTLTLLSFPALLLTMTFYAPKVSTTEGIFALSPPFTPDTGSFAL